MALETASYISQLNPANPSGADRVHQGDDHIRLLKAVLKATFPNITGPITATQDQLNTDFTVPTGVIVSWYGDAASVPSGWAICNGQTVNRTDGQGEITLPDLRDRVVIGAGLTHAPLATPGAATQSINTGSAGTHTHTAGSAGAHTHAATVSSTSTGGSVATTTRVVDGSGQSQALATATFQAPAPHTHIVTNAEAPAHTHSISEGGAHTHSVQVSTLQPSLALYHIMKI